MRRARGSSDAIFLYRGGELRKLVAAGDEAPGGGVFSVPSFPRLVNRDGSFGFLGPHLVTGNSVARLRARIYDYEVAKREAKAAEDAKARLKIEWGSQIRSYVLFPYQQVNDHRTELKTANVSGVLDGDLDELIRTFLLQNANKTN